MKKQKGDLAWNFDVIIYEVGVKYNLNLTITETSAGFTLPLSMVFLKIFNSGFKHYLKFNISSGSQFDGVLKWRMGQYGIYHDFPEIK